MGLVELTGLYWRRNALRANDCPPGLLAISDGRVSFTTSEERVFDVDASSVRGALDSWGSLVLHVADRKYIFATSVGAYSRPFSETQKRAMTLATQSRTLRTLRELPSALNGAGATITAARFSLRPLLLGITIVVAIAVIAYSFSRQS